MGEKRTIEEISNDPSNNNIQKRKNDRTSEKKM